MTATQEIELLIKQLEIVIDHCNETGLKAGAGAVQEAIKIIRTGAEMVALVDRINNGGT